MNRLFRSALVIGRRDFAATVFSKTFIFFLIGPLFPVLFGGIFGGIGARVASQADQPTIAVIASNAEFARLSAAHNQLQSAMGSHSGVQLARAEPLPDARKQENALLQSKDDPVIGVLRGGLDHPRLTGAVDPDGDVAAQMKLLLQAANAPEPQLEVTRTEASSGSVNRTRTLTAQGGQMLLFFLTVLLAGMTLSQLIEEKSNKVIEILAAAVPIEAVFLGKLFAMLAASILGVAVWAGAAAVLVALLMHGGGLVIAPPAVGWTAFVILTVIYFAMNYLLLGSVFLSIGAQASTVREVQTLSMPVMLGQVLVFSFAALAVGSPDSPAAVGGAIFPLSSPLVMVARAAERPELWPHLAALLWQMLWVGLIIRMSAGLFRRTVLKSGPVSRRWWRRARA